MTAHSHYSGVDMKVLSEGYAPNYMDEAQEEIQVEVAPLVARLARGLESSIVPKRQ